MNLLASNIRDIRDQAGCVISCPYDFLEIVSG